MPRTHLTILAPCAENWDAMTPASGGRHCAACQKTVVDFSQKTDAEILSILTKAAGGETCGRFGADQLNRPLLPALRPTLRKHWQAWAAIVLAACGLRASPAEAASARAPSPPSTLRPARKATPAHPANQSLRGLVRDAATHQPLARVAVFLKGENRMTMTDAEGRFSLQLPARRAHSRHTLAIHRTGYQSKAIQLPEAEAMHLVRIELRDDVTQALVVAPFQPVQRQMISGGISSVMAAELTEPAPAPAGERPGSFFRWLTKSFRREHRLPE